MTPRSRSSRRLRRLTEGLLASVALFLGFSTSGASGCVNCPDQHIAERYSFEIVMSGWSPGSGRVDVTDSDLTITYSTTDGSKWKVVYTRTGVLERP